MWFTSVCLCGRHSSASSRLLQLIFPALFSCTLIAAAEHTLLIICHEFPPQTLFSWSCNELAVVCLHKTKSDLEGSVFRCDRTLIGQRNLAFKDTHVAFVVKSSDASLRREMPLLHTSPSLRKPSHSSSVVT